MTFARLSAVYGLSFTDISAMPISAIRAYVERIPAIQAEMRLIQGDAALLPHVQNPKAVLRAWRRDAYEFSGKQDAKVATPGVLKMMGIGVEYAS